jgi:RNA polymerase sigma factor (sigma-70 family)
VAVREVRSMTQLEDTAATTAAVAFEDFFETERRQLFRALCLMTGDQGEAEELAQDAFLAVWERWDRVRVMERPAGYLYRIAMNGFRSRRRRAVRATRLAGRPHRPADPYEGADLRDAILRALDRLGGRQRAAVVLTEYLGYTSPEAARLLGIKPTSVRSLAAEARAAMKQELERGDG